MPSPSEHEIANAFRETTDSLVSAGADRDAIQPIALAFFLDGTVPPAAEFTPEEPTEEEVVEEPAPPPPPKPKRVAKKK